MKESIDELNGMQDAGDAMEEVIVKEPESAAELAQNNTE